MAAEDSTVFPAYRRMVGVRRYYKIHSPRAFTEVEVIGSRRLVHEVDAKMYPELLRIQEMLDCTNGVYEAIPSAIWSTLLNGN